MRTIARICTVAIAALPAASLAESPLQIFDKMEAQEQAGIRDNKDVTVKKSTMDIDQIDYYESQAVPGLKNSKGEQMYVLRTVPPQEIAERRQQANQLANANPEQLREAADEIEQKMNKVDDQMQAHMGEAHLPGGMMNVLQQAPADKPWLMPTPKNIGGMYATMLRGAAAGKEEQAARDDPAAIAQERENVRALVNEKSEFRGKETIDGIETLLVVADNLDQRQVMEDGSEFTLNSMNMWIDAANDVPIRFRMEGEMRDGAETRQVRIEREEKDYRHVEGCGRLYWPFSSVMRISGVMSPKEQAQMAEAQEKLAEFDKQLAQMPQAQRDMIMRQMGPRMEMMRKMASGGGIEIESHVVQLECNTGLPDPVMMAQATMGGGLPGMGAAGRPADSVLPYYVDEKGIGVIRYADPDNAKGPYFLTLSNKGSGTVVAGPLGPYNGPKVGIYIGSLKMLGLPYDDIELELYQDGPHRTAARFRPEVDPAKAESQADCGKPSATGECSQ